MDCLYLRHQVAARQHVLDIVRDGWRALHATVAGYHRDFEKHPCVKCLAHAYTSLRQVSRPCIYELLRSANLLLCVLAIPACIDKFTDFPTNSNCLSSFVEIRTVYPLASTGVPTTPPCRCHHGSRPVNWNNTCSKRQKGKQRSRSQNMHDNFESMFDSQFFACTEPEEPDDIKTKNCGLPGSLT